MASEMHGSAAARRSAGRIVAFSMRAVRGVRLLGPDPRHEVVDHDRGRLEAEPGRQVAVGRKEDVDLARGTRRGRHVPGRVGQARDAPAEARRVEVAPGLAAVENEPHVPRLRQPLERAQQLADVAASAGRGLGGRTGVDANRRRYASTSRRSRCRR